MTVHNDVWENASQWTPVKRQPNVLLELFRVLSWVGVFVFFVAGGLALVTRMDAFMIASTVGMLMWVVCGVIVLRSIRSTRILRL